MLHRARYLRTTFLPCCLDDTLTRGGHQHHKITARKATREVRARVCAGVLGNVVEVGFGTGLNVPYYPTEVTKVLAVAPSARTLTW
jgi:hypothetical protein